MSKVTVEQARNMTNQEAFNLIWERAKDERRAIDTEGYSNVCRYRTLDGLECFYGHIIPDEDYKADYEGTSVKGICGKFHPNVSESLLERCQIVHDIHQPKNWKDSLRSIANSLNLTIPNE